MAPPRPMRPAEFVERGEILFGKNWRKPLARLIDRGPRMVRLYARGTFPVPLAIAAELRRLTDIGEAGALIREAIRRAVPELRPFDANTAAKEVLAALEARNMTIDPPPPESESAPRRRRWQSKRLGRA